MSATGQVSLGDYVELRSGEQDKDGNDRPWIMRVAELFEDVKVQACSDCHQLLHTAVQPA